MKAPKKAGKRKVTVQWVGNAMPATVLEGERIEVRHQPNGLVTIIDHDTGATVHVRASAVSVINEEWVSP